MIITKMFKIIIKSLFLYFFIISSLPAAEEFSQWLKKFQIKAIDSGISRQVVNEVMSNAKF